MNPNERQPPAPPNIQTQGMLPASQDLPSRLIKPVISEIASGRSGFETPLKRPLLKVEKVQGVNTHDIKTNSPLYAYRILVTDDERRMYACLVPELHNLVESHVIVKGAYIRPTDYDLQTLPKKSNETKCTRYLLIRDMIVEHSPTLRFGGDGEGRERKIAAPKGRFAQNSSKTWPDNAVEPKSIGGQQELSKDNAKSKSERPGRPQGPIMGSSAARFRPRVGAPEEIDSNTSVTPDGSPTKTPRVGYHSQAGRSSGTPKIISPVKRPSFIFSQSSQIPPSSHPPLVLPELTNLGDLLQKSHNDKINVLAVINWIADSTIGRSIGIKRDIDLIDPTADRPIRMSVWCDAQQFYPPVGTVVLFRGVTVHRYDTRSLNAFTDLLGTRWFEADPDIPETIELKRWHDELLKEHGRQRDEDVSTPK